MYKILPDVRYVFGVDWNGERHGVQIVIGRWEKWIEQLESIDESNDTVLYKFRLIDRKIVSKKDYTLSTSVKILLELNKIYDPIAIAVDAGYGAMQIEELKKYGELHPESGLSYKLISLESGSSVEITDPWDRGRKKKISLKNDMIATLQWLFETDLLILPEEENSRDGLVGQLRNYQVTRYDTDGRAIYTKGDDHAHDAYLLAVYALKIKLINMNGQENHVNAKLSFFNPLLLKNPLFAGRKNINRNLEEDLLDQFIDKNDMNEFDRMKSSIIPVMQGGILINDPERLGGASAGSSRRYGKSRPGSRKFW